MALILSVGKMVKPVFDLQRNGSGKTAALPAGMLLGNSCLQFYTPTFYADRVLDLLAPLVLKFFRLFADETLEILQTGSAGLFSGFRASVNQLLIKLLYLFFFTLRIRK